MICGRALETIVEDRIATNMPSSSPESASMICRCVMTGVPVAWPAGAGWVVLDIKELLDRGTRLRSKGS